MFFIRLREKLPAFYFYYIGLLILAISLPCSKYFTSIAQFMITINWLYDGFFLNKFPEYWLNLKQRKSAILLISIFLLHILGLIYTTDFQYAFHDIKIKLPLLIFPLVLSTIETFEYKHIKTILIIFAGSVFVTSLIGIFRYYNIDNQMDVDNNALAVFISHIRFSLLIDIAIFSLGYFIYRSNILVEKLAYVLVILWLTFFLFLLQSLTGIIVFLILILMSFIVLIIKRKRFYFKVISGIFILASFLIIGIYLFSLIHHFYNVEKVDFQSLPKKTANGNSYLHDTLNRQIENGHYICLNICEKELKTEWNKRSIKKYDIETKEGQDLKSILLRYLTAKGLRKDSVGVSKLTQHDISLIESGYPNPIYANRWSFTPKIYQLLWVIDVYKKGGNPSGHSVTQRIEYLRAAFGIIENNFFFGVGTGDVPKAFENQYVAMKTRLLPEFRHRAHNQYVTFFITFGFFGFLWFLLALIYPAIFEDKFNNYLFIVFFVTACISMFNEDTLETQAGVTFFAFFYTFFAIFIKSNKMITN